MNRKKNTEGIPAAPSSEAIRRELAREKYKERYKSTFRSTLYVLIVVAAITILVATTFMPVFRTYGDSMTPTLNESDIVLALKGSQFDTGDVIGMYVGNKLLIKRVIAGPGQWVDISADGDVSIDGKKIYEPYVTEKAFGDTNIELPYQVPDGRYFVMGDHRATSLDSRNTAVGCIADEQIVGRIFFRVWPLHQFGQVDQRKEINRGNIYG